MWCPICGVEYRPGFTRCSECDAGLVATPPETLDTDLVRNDEPRVTVFVGRPGEADAARSLLLDGGVPAAIAPAASDATRDELAAVVVRTADLERALEIGGAAEWETVPIRPGDSIADGETASPADPGDVDGLHEDDEPAAAPPDEPSEEEIAWYFAIARFLLWVLAAVVVLIVVSRALT
jgi:hypothetical protein